VIIDPSLYLMDLNPEASTYIVLSPLTLALREL